MGEIPKGITPEALRITEIERQRRGGLITEEEKDEKIRRVEHPTREELDADLEGGLITQAEYKEHLAQLETET